MSTDLAKILALTINPLPRHVAIIMDGNNRWAKHRKLAGAAGHKAGLDAVRAAIETAVHYQLQALTLFAFSSENWRRPELEVKALMDLFVYVLQREVEKLHSNNIRLRIIGDRKALNGELQQLIEQAEALTGNNIGLQLNIAANYSGQWDIVQATSKLAQAVVSGSLDIANIDNAQLASYLCIADLPAVDLCIRTGGEQRISNFLLWQLAYTELYFIDTLWPEFKHQHFVDSLVDFSQRQRRFGQTSEQVQQQAPD